MKTIRLIAERKPQSEKKSIKGVDFNISLSPFYLPDRLRCDYDPQGGYLIIHFDYLDDEPSVHVENGDNLFDLEVGQFTGRIKAMKIKVDEHDLDKVKLQLKGRVNEALSHARDRSPEMAENYDIAKEVLEAHKDEVASVVPA